MNEDGAGTYKLASQQALVNIQGSGRLGESVKISRRCRAAHPMGQDISSKHFNLQKGDYMGRCRSRLEWR